MYVTGKVGVLKLGLKKWLIMPKSCEPPVQRPVKKVTFAPVLVTVPEEEEEVPVTENNASLQDRTVVDIPERPFREDTGVTLPRVETVRTLQIVSTTLRLPKPCCTETCLYSTLIVLMCILFLYLAIWLLCIFVFDVVAF
jgi:hypothetical protein